MHKSYKYGDSLSHSVTILVHKVPITAGLTEAECLPNTSTHDQQWEWNLLSTCLSSGWRRYASTYMIVIQWAPSVTDSRNYPLKLRHNREKSIAGSPCGDPGLESCKNPTAIRRLSTPWARIRRRTGKFNLQLKFAGWSADSLRQFCHLPATAGTPSEHRVVTWGPPSDFSWENIAKNRSISAGPLCDHRTEIGRRSSGVYKRKIIGRWPADVRAVAVRPPHADRPIIVRWIHAFLLLIRSIKAHLWWRSSQKARRHHSGYYMFGLLTPYSK